jgi:hypothetical protein
LRRRNRSLGLEKLRGGDQSPKGAVLGSATGTGLPGRVF